MDIIPYGLHGHHVVSPVVLVLEQEPEYAMIHRRVYLKRIEEMELIVLVWHYTWKIVLCQDVKVR